MGELSGIQGELDLAEDRRDDDPAEPSTDEDYQPAPSMIVRRRPR
jgi:hypothetical protein